MARVKKQPTGRADLIEIWQYMTALKMLSVFFDTLKGKIDPLSDNPEMGKRREELG